MRVADLMTLRSSQRVNGRSFPDLAPNVSISVIEEMPKIHWRYRSDQIKTAPMIQATIYAPHWGNSPETMVTQLVADELCITPDQVSVVYGDTKGGLLSFGPAGSRYTGMIAGAIAGACAIMRPKMLRVAAHMLGVTPDQIGMFDGKLFVIHEPKKCLTFAELGTANRLFRLSFPRDESFQSGISAEFTYDHPYNSLPNADRTDLGVYYPIVGHACHIVVAEIDEETGRVQFPRYIAVHDTGTIVNPKLVDGQIRGGIAQGIGTALYEQYLYDEEGQLLNASLSEYLVPSASEIPDIEIAHLETPSPFTQRGIKGCGEGGRLASIPAIASAIDDAFADEGVFVNILPVTPSALHRLRATAREDVSRRTQ